MKKYIDLIRVKHWVKNILIFVPMVCSGRINYYNYLKVLGGFFAFSFISSFIYIINDIFDIEKDKLHPQKKFRPLANGKIKKDIAIIIAIMMLLASLLLNIFIASMSNYESFTFLILYIIINILYSIGLKNVSIVDICLLACGFVLRVYYGASILNISVSNWLFLTILSSSLFLGLGKRKKEYLNNKEYRKVLSQYNETFLTNFLYLYLCLTLVFYSLWALEQSNKYLIFTMPILLVIFMKYCLVMEKSDEGDPTTILYNDPILLLICVLYGIIMILLFMVT